MQFKLSSGTESITVSPKEDNQEELFVYNATGGNALTIIVIKDDIDTDWKRNFTIYDKADSALQDFTLMKIGNYCIKSSTLASKLNAGEVYHIYTTALPKDPEKAMLVKIRRILVCKIKTR